MTERTTAELRKEKYGAFREHISGFLNATLTVSSSALSQLDNRIHRITRRHARLQREKDSLELRMMRLGEMDVASMVFDTAFPDQIERMETRDAANNTKILEVYTDLISLIADIPAIGQHVTVPVGKFRITVSCQTNDTGVSDMQVKAVNTTARYRHTDHPHVSNGSICWGELQEVVIQKQRSSAVCELVDLTIQLLTSYNPGSAFVNLLTGWAHHMPIESRICPRCIKPVQEVMIGSVRVKCGCTPQQVAVEIHGEQPRAPEPTIAVDPVAAIPTPPQEAQQPATLQPATTGLRIQF